MVSASGYSEFTDDSFQRSPQNDAALEELVGAIALSQGADALNLLLVRCNYGQLRERVVAALLTQLESEALEGPVHIVSSGADMYAQIQTTMQEGTPGAVILLVEETGAELDTVLVELNNRREEFRRHVRFPLVVWLTDAGYQHLSQLANDFESIAGGEAIAFRLSGDELAQRLQDAAQAMFEALLTPDSPASFNRRLKEMELGYLSADEVAIAVTDLQVQHYPISPELQASLDFARGLNVPNYEAIALFERCATYWDEVGTAEASLKQGVALYYLGQAYYFVIDSLQYQQRGEAGDWAIALKQAAGTAMDGQPRHDFSKLAKVMDKQEADRWAIAVPPLETCLDIFEQANRPDLVAVSINRLERTLHRLQRWDNLDELIRRARPLHETYGSVSKLSQDYGFLADIALHREQWPEAARLAQQAIELFEPKGQPPIKTSWWPSLYRFLLAKAERALGHVEAATAQLQQAKTMGVMDRPTLYSAVLSLLQECLRDQGQYLEAFELKQERLSVEKQYGLRAFIGAGRLRSQRVEQRPTVQSGRQTLEEIAPEIASSGRYKDLEELLHRIAGTSHKLIVLHGDSGVGKSSLVNGGLIPALQAKALENRTNVPILLRRYTNWQRELTTALEDALPQSIPGMPPPQPSLGSPNTPRENPREGAADPISPLGKGRLRGVKAEAAASQSPVSKAEGRRQKAEDSPVQQPTANIQNPILTTLQHCEDRSLRPVLIFDQFEEFFFANPDRVARRDFFQFIADCLEFPSALKIVFSLREDYLHYLLEAKKLVRRSDLKDGSMARSQLEDILGKQTLYEIGNFSPEDAKAIIQQLTAGARMYLEPALVDALVADLAGTLGEVRPIEMQIVGAQLQTEGIQTLARYEELEAEPKETLVQRYLQDVVTDCGDQETQRLAELVLFLLTDERGTRPLKTKLELIRESATLGENPKILLEAREAELDATKTKYLSSQIELILRVFCGSGIVIYLPEEIHSRYQLVHDYISENIRQKYGFHLHALVRELKKEKNKREQAEIAQRLLIEKLDYVNQANLLIANSQEKSKSSFPKGLKSATPLFLNSFVFIILISILNSLKIFQPIELSIFDQWTRLRPEEAKDSRIVIVGLDEDDIRETKTFPISDLDMAKLLDNIRKNKPRVIGLDIYRDLAHEPGSQELNEIFETTPNLIGIEKLPDGENLGVSPPYTLDKNGQIGFSNILIDPDGRIRRALFYWNINSEYRTSFSLKVSLLYLAQEGILPKASKKKYLMLGKMPFPQFQANDGGYVQADHGGYQTIINFRNHAHPFEYVSFREVLSGTFPSDLMTDRIVLIGYTAPSAKDNFFVPYNGGFGSRDYGPISGVELHAQFVSNIISAALDNRQILTVFPDWFEYLLLLFWAMIAFYTWKLYESSFYIFFVFIIITGMIISCFLFFYFSLIWIPLVPKLMSVLGIYVIILLYGRKEMEKLRFSEFLKLVRVAKTDDLKIRKLAVEYLVSASNPQSREVISELSKEIWFEIQSCKSISDIIFLPTQLEWMIEPIPNTFHDLIPKFIGFSKELGKLQESPQKKGEGTLIKIKSELMKISKNPCYEHEFQKNAHGWAEILNAYLKDRNEY